MPRTIIKIPSVIDQTCFSRTQIWRKSNDPNDEFPEPVQLGANSIGWFQDEITQYVESRPRGHLTQAPKLEEHQRNQRKSLKSSEAEPVAASYNTLATV